MLELSQQQRQLLCDFIRNGRQLHASSGAPLEKALTYIMSKVDVRKAEQIAEPVTRELVVCTFALLKNEYLFDNCLISSSQYQEAISNAQASVWQYHLDAQPGGRHDDWVSSG